MDVNGDGGVDVNELQYALAKLGLPMCPNTLYVAMRKFDVQGAAGQHVSGWRVSG